MIDTIRLKIFPISESHRELLMKLSKMSYFTDVKGETSQNLFGAIALPPYDYEINFFFDRYRRHLLYVECSLPKIWYGENVHLLYEVQFEPVLQMIFRTFLKLLGSFPDISTWEVQRLDTTYSWKFPSEEESIQFIEEVESLILPRNSKHFYGEHESVVFGSKKSKTLTFYRKYPEFTAKDQLLLIKKGFCEKALDTNTLAEGVVRFEVMNRTDSLKAFFKTNFPITIDKFLEKGIIAKLITYNLSRLQGSVTSGLKEDRLVLSKLQNRYKRNIALRLFGFFKAYYSKIETNRLIHQKCNSGDISKNKKELLEAGIVLPIYLSTAKFDFSIPSPLVVNKPPSLSAVADELGRNLKLIDNNISYLGETIIEEKLPNIDDIGL